MARKSKYLRDAIEVMRQQGPQTAMQMWLNMGGDPKDERRLRGLYAALRRAHDRGEVEMGHVEATHFHGYRGGVSNVYALPGSGIEGVRIERKMDDEDL